MEKKLLPHNAAPYEEIMKMFEKENVFLYESAMGTGKTYVIATALKEKNYNALVLIPNNTISHTWEKIAQEFGLYIETMTYSMFSRKDLPEIYLMAAKYNVIICDECHHVGAEIWGENLKTYRDYIEGMRDTYLIGLTATRIRYLDDMNDVSKSFFKNNLVEGFTLGDAIAEGVLPTFTYVSALFSPAGELNAIKEKISDANLSEEDISTVDELVTRLQLDIDNIEAMEDILKRNLGDKKHKTLVFVDKIDYIPETRARLRKVFDESNMFTVHSEYSLKKNKLAIKNFEETKGSATMLAINMFNEGLHLDGVDVIVMLRKTISVNLFMQQLGRIMTPDNMNKELFVFDFVGNHTNLKTDGRVIDLINELNREVTRKSGGNYQLIVDDLARSALDLFSDIGLFLNKGKAWTQDEDDILYEFYPREKRNVCERLPGRTERACNVRAGILGIRKSSKPWTKEEHNIIVEYFPIEGADVAHRLPNRTKEACIVRGRAVLRGVPFMDKVTSVSWTDKEIAIMKKYYPLEGSKVCERLPGRTAIHCISIAQTLKLNSPRTWSKEEIEILKENYPVIGKECFKMLPKRSFNSCQAKVKKLNLEKEK